MILCIIVEHCCAVVKHRILGRRVVNSIPKSTKCCVLEQDTLSTLLSTGFYPGRKRATRKISTSLLNVFSTSINKVIFITITTYTVKLLYIDIGYNDEIHYNNNLNGTIL